MARNVFSGGAGTFGGGGGSETDPLAILKSILTTKGDIVAATGSATPERVGAGANGTVLKSDSTAPAGVVFSSPTYG